MISLDEICPSMLGRALCVFPKKKISALVKLQQIRENEELIVNFAHNEIDSSIITSFSPKSTPERVRSSYQDISW